MNKTKWVSTAGDNFSAPASAHLPREGSYVLFTSISNLFPGGTRLRLVVFTLASVSTSGSKWHFLLFAADVAMSFHSRAVLKIRLIQTAVLIGAIACTVVDAAGTTLAVSSTEDSFINAIEGFGTDLQCFVNSCVSPGRTVKWFKDNRLIAEGTTLVSNSTKMFVRHNVELDHTKDCTGRCSSLEQCGAGYDCLDNSCCKCEREEFTLVIYNLSLTDSGIYQCRLDEGNYMEFEMQVLRSRRFPDFAQNLTFDYNDCCQQNGMSSECRPMCRPGAMETHKFDPIPCQKEFGKLLPCATREGNTSHVHCCRLHFVPPLCWDYCSGTNTRFDRANLLCVDWMPEIFQCYEQTFLPLPGYPEQLEVNPVNSTSLFACWQPPRQRPESVNYYNVRFQEVPHFPLFGGAVPFMPDEEGQSGFDESEVPPLEPDMPDGSTLIRRPAMPPVDGHGDADRTLTMAKRRKRQTLVITMHNFATNETEVREYRYKELNTSDKCATIEDLKPATQYAVYVTATNSYGVGLPSVHVIVSTPDVPISNDSLPNIRECCVNRKVDEECVSKMCDVGQPPSAVGAFDIALTCRSEFPQVAPCLADGRNHTACCRDKGVSGECMKLCDGSASSLGATSVLCLSLEMNAIYSCLRQGYATHPSPPTNVTVTRIIGSAAMIKWSPPKNNAEKVISYSLFHRPLSEGGYKEVQNVTSPYELEELLPDTSYSIYLIAYTPEGTSLRSSTIQFTTGEHPIDGMCEFGQPLLNAYGSPVLCGPRAPCPVLFDCVGSEYDDTDARYCCPTRTVAEPDGDIPEPNITACCVAKGVRGNCMGLCSYSTTTDDLIRSGRDCMAHLKTWVNCGGVGRDDRQCCTREQVPDPCTDFCYPSAVETMRIHAEHIPCVRYVREISKCGLEGIYSLPGVPRNLRVLDRGVSWVALLWEKPIRSVPAEAYEVSLIDDSNVLTFNATTVSLTIPDLKRDVKYTAHVRSLNSKGASVPTENLTFTLGEDLPTAPVNLTVAWYRNQKANVTWAWTRDTLNKQAVHNYEFNVTYGESVQDNGRINWSSVTTKDYFAVLDNLKAESNYDVYLTVKSADTRQQSVPSSVVNFRTALARAAPTAEIESIPPGELNVGDKVAVSCVARGDPTPNVTISTNNRRLAFGVGSTSAVIEKVTLEDSSEYVECSADNGDFVPVRTTLWLKVRFRPNVSAYVDAVTVVEELPAHFACRVRGQPTPDVTWYYQADESKSLQQTVRQLSPDEQHLIETKGGEDNSFNATLTIYQAGKAHAGYYYCKACNDLGCTNSSMKLIVESWPVPQGPDYLLACCKQEGILPECMSACTEDIDMRVYEQNVRCVDEFPKLLACTKDGVDQSSCCKARGVPAECLSYCNRRLLGNGEMRLNLESCQRYTSPIIGCAAEAHKVVPGTPVNVRVQVMDSHAVNVTWDAPAKKGDIIPMYVVYYKRQGEDRYSTVRTDKTWARLPNLETGSEYNITVIAANSYGYSLFTPLISKRISDTASGHGSHGAAGTVLAIFVCFILAAILVLAAVYFTRKPNRLPSFLLKLTQRRRRQQRANGSTAVAFENPGYDKEAQIRGLPGDKTGESESIDCVNGSNSNGNSAGWDQPHLETPHESPAPQRSGKYKQLT